MNAKLGTAVYIGFCTHNQVTGVLAAADALPTFAVYEQGGDVALSSGNCVARGALLGHYYTTFTAAILDGYEATKDYCAVVTCVVNGVTYAQVFNFHLDARELTEIPANVADTVWDEASVDHVFAGSMGAFLRDLRDEALGKWILDPALNTLTLYRVDGVTVLATLNLTSTASAVPAYVRRTPA